MLPGVPGDLAGLAGEVVTAFLLIVSRVSVILLMMPGIGDSEVPARVRVMLALLVSLMVLSLGVVRVPEGLGPAGLGALIAIEAATGLIFGLLLRLCTWSLQIVGAVVAQSVGLSQLLGFAREDEAQAITSRLLVVAGTTLLLTLDVHVHVIAALGRTYETIPLGSLRMDALLDEAMMRFNAALGFGFLAGWAFVVISLVYNVALGFLNRALPQLMVALVGAPFIVGVGLVLLAMASVALLMMWSQALPGMLDWL